MKIRNILPEFKIAGQPDPKDAADYKEKMKTLQQIQNDPKMRDPQTQATIAKRKEELRRWAEKNLPREEILDIDESGIMYKAGVKKYGKDGMRKIQSAAGKGASHQEIGKIKDKYVKDDADIDQQMKVDILQFLNTKVAGIERQIEMQPAFTQEDIDNKEFTLKLIDFVQKKLDDKQKGD